MILKIQGKVRMDKKNKHQIEEVDRLKVLSESLGEDVDLHAVAVATNLYRAAQSLRIVMERDVLSAHKLSWTAFSLLYDVWVWGQRETKELAVSSGVTTATISTITNTLERKGLCKRSADPRDRRRVSISLTEKGEQVIKELYPKFHQGEKKLVHSMEVSEQERLAEQLRYMIQNINNV
ncbi:DNA-binding transcriptional regulator, MarR family [Priestia flexa]|jgi:MarR family transcriptional regulator, 2-MHQ and catechol-resistance regulon repressor|nr:MarR family transcriptional regulator [Priestia flexa]MED3825273.1 MarR family transcriptional regulator [Priestia flexa]SIQ20582.1 DNA-binding transcriptional regulator, MarR family [Priestia flexa]